MSENLYQGESLMSKFKTKKWTLLYKEISKLTYCATSNRLRENL